MKKIEAPTLEDAYEIAARELSCSITELNYEVIQRPSNGLMGMFKKTAIIVAECKRVQKSDAPSERTKEVNNSRDKIEKIFESRATEEKHVSQKLFEKTESTKRRTKEDTSEKNITKDRAKHEIDKALTEQDDAVNESFYTTSDIETIDEQIVTVERPENNNLELAEKIESQLTELLSYICLDIDTIEVDVVGDTALIFIDGHDAALLIGKEGYRYNALSYMIFNWLHGKYDLYIKLEVAQFITTQQEMIKNHIKPVIEYVNINGRGKTRPLDGILVQIALEQLRAEFPNKYVAIKTGRDGRKFVIINEFNNRKHA